MLGLRFNPELLDGDWRVSALQGDPDAVDRRLAEPVGCEHGIGGEVLAGRAGLRRGHEGCGKADVFEAIAIPADVEWLAIAADPLAVALTASGADGDHAVRGTVEGQRVDVLKAKEHEDVVHGD